MLLLRFSVIVLSFVANTFSISVKKASYNDIQEEVVNEHSTGVPPLPVGNAWTYPK